MSCNQLGDWTCECVCVALQARHKQLHGFVRFAIPMICPLRIQSYLGILGVSVLRVLCSMIRLLYRFPFHEPRASFDK